MKGIGRLRGFSYSHELLVLMYVTLLSLCGYVSLTEILYLYVGMALKMIHLIEAFLLSFFVQ